MNEFQKQCLSVLNRFAELNVLDRAGRHVRPGSLDRLRDRRGHMERNAVAALAMAGGPPWPVERHPAADELLDLAAGVMDLWADELIERCRKADFPPDFDMVSLAPSFQLVGGHGAAAQRRRWRQALADCARVGEEFLRARESAWGKPGPFTGCGPNHLFIVASPLYRIGQVLQEPRWTRLAERAMRALCRLQSREGYFPEDSGPAVRYQRVSLFGVCDYYAASGDRAVAGCVDRGIRFVARAMYPDLTPIETIDQRNRTGARPGRPGQELHSWELAFGRTPLGRRLAIETLARIARRLDERPDEVRFPHAGMVALAAATDDGGGRASPTLPCLRDAYTDRFDGLAGIVRRDGWCVALSGYHRSDRLGNPFILERTQNVSVFCDRAGLLIGGGNDKHRRDAATFDLVESGYVHYFPPIGARCRAGGRQATLDLDYGAAHARLVATVRSPRLVELVAGAVTRFSHQVNRFNLQLPVGPGAKVKIDGRPIRLSEKATEQGHWPVRRRIEFAGVAIEPAGGGEFCWPHLPHNSYNQVDYTSPITAAVGYLRLGLTGKNISERTVRVRG